MNLKGLCSKVFQSLYSDRTYSTVYLFIYLLLLSSYDPIAYHNFSNLCCRKRDERLRRVFEAKVKEEQRDEEKKKKFEQKMAQIDEMKNDKVCNTFHESESIFTPITRNLLVWSISSSHIWSLHAACGRWEGQEEGGPETTRGSGAEEEVGGRGSEEEDSTSSEMKLIFVVGCAGRLSVEQSSTYWSLAGYLLPYVFKQRPGPWLTWTAEGNIIGVANSYACKFCIKPAVKQIKERHINLHHVLVCI